MVLYWPSALPELVTLSQYEAVELFIQRSQAVKPAFKITSANAPAVAEICARLDGLPLAIERAAARSKLLSPQALLARLNSRLTLLTGGGRDLPLRQQTLRNTIDWSYQLLDRAEQSWFARLAVFAGGWSLEAVAAVCNAEDELGVDPLDGLGSLIDKSLLQQEDGPDGDTRYIMLETLHEYARERLEASGEAEQLLQRHAAYFVALAEAAEPELRGEGQARWLRRLEQEQANLRAALSWAVGRGAWDTVGRLSGALGTFWAVRGHVSEGRRWLALVVAQHTGVSDGVRAKALAAAGRLASMQMELEPARALYEESLALARDLGDKPGMARVLNNLGILAEEHEDEATARALYEESLMHYRALGDTYGMSIALNNLGNQVLHQGDVAAARVLLEETLTLARLLGDTYGIGIALDNLGFVANRQHDYGLARMLFEESLTLARELGDKAGMAHGLNNLGISVLFHGDHAAARALITEGLALARELGDPLDISYSLGNLGHVALQEGDDGAARALYEECLLLHREREITGRIAGYLEGLALLASAQGEVARVLRLAGAAAALRKPAEVPLAPALQVRLDAALAAVRQDVGPAASALWNEGQRLSKVEVMHYVLEWPAATDNESTRT